MEERRPYQTHRSPHFHNSRFLTHHFLFRSGGTLLSSLNSSGSSDKYFAFLPLPTVAHPLSRRSNFLLLTHFLLRTLNTAAVLFARSRYLAYLFLSLSLKIPLPPSSIFSMDTLLWQRPQAGQISNSRPGNGSVVTVSLPSSP